ncbi:MAG: hypothetical protein H6836_02245 [Planctomycetes bacterium]|nr:hypothetical protein [Planctomycetota bacterium]
MRGSIAVAVLCAPWLLAGCLELEQTITIAPDGSGTHRLRMKMPLRLLCKLEAQAAVVRPQADRAQLEVAAIFKRDKAGRELASAGMTLRKHEVLERRDTRVLQMEAGFKGLSELRRNPLTGGQADWILKKGPAGRTALFFFPMGKQAWKDAQLRIKELERKPSALMLAYFRSKQAELRGLDLKLTLELPGRVVGRSANLSAGAKPNQVVAHIDAASIRTPRDLLASLAPCYAIEFDSRGCTFTPR